MKFFFGLLLRLVSELDSPYNSRGFEEIFLSFETNGSLMNIILCFLPSVVDYGPF